MPTVLLGAVRGHLRQRTKGSWELAVDIGTDPVTGRRRQLFRTFRGTKREAEDALAKLVAEAADGKLSATERTFGELLQRWVDQRAIDWSPTTAYETRRI